MYRKYLLQVVALVIAASWAQLACALDSILTLGTSTATPTATNTPIPPTPTATPTSTPTPTIALGGLVVTTYWRWEVVS